MVVLIDSVAKVKDFICITSRFDNLDIKINCQNRVVNGKSILGVMTLDLSSPVELEIKKSDKMMSDSDFKNQSEKLLNTLEKFAA